MLFEFHGETVSTATGWFFFLPKPGKDRVQLARLLANPDVAKVFHNSKFDRHFLRQAGLPVHGRVYDTFPMAKLWNENRSDHKLKSLAAELFDPTAADDKDDLDTWLKANKKTWSDLESVPEELLGRYGANDSRVTLGLFNALQVELQKQNIPAELVELEMDVLDIAYEMEMKGCVINKAFLTKYSAELEAQQKALYPEMVKSAGREFNPESAAEVTEILQKLGADLSKVTTTGKYGVDKRVLEGFPHPFTKALLEHRRLGTIRSTFVEGMLSRSVKRDDGWTVHTNYNTAGASTGRWSSNDPNLQNVDKKSKARQGIVPRKGTELWLFDFKQIEPVIFAHFSESKRLIQAFKDGLDYHSFNASMAFGVPIDQVTPEQRTKAKGLGLAIMYQAGAAKAAQMMGVELEEGRRILNGFYAALPEVKELQKKTARSVEDRAKYAAEKAGKLREVGYRKYLYNGEPLPIRKVPKAGQPGEFWEFTDWEPMTETGWVKSPFGRKRRLVVRDNYKALNALIQGSAGDLLKHAMQRIRTATGRIPLLQVHDELGYELEKKGAEKAALEIKTAMESVQEFFPNVPIRVDVAKAPKNWGEEIEVKL